MENRNEDLEDAMVMIPEFWIILESDNEIQRLGMWGKLCLLGITGAGIPACIKH